MNQYAVKLPVRAREHQGRPCYQVGKKRALLVRREKTGEPWRLVESLNQELSHLELVRYYGFWIDREVATGTLFWKRVSRPLDGKIQDDEVESFAVRVAYSWESHNQVSSAELPHIEQMTLSLNPSYGNGVGTLSEVWVR